MESLKLNKCGNCGSENLKAIKESEGFRITCETCGRELFVGNDDKFLIQLYSKLIEVANALQQDYIVNRWNKYNEG